MTTGEPISAFHGDDVPPGARVFVGAATLLITPATVSNPFGLVGTVAPGFLEPASGRRRVSGPAASNTR